MPLQSPLPLYRTLTPLYAAPPFIYSRFKFYLFPTIPSCSSRSQASAVTHNELAFSFDSCRIPNERSLFTQGISVLIWYEFYFPLFLYNCNTHPGRLPFALTTEYWSITYPTGLRTREHEQANNRTCKACSCVVPASTANSISRPAGHAPL
jgi:hypothetical protein